MADEAEAIDLFGAACDVAAEFGLTVDLEFLPMLAVDGLAKAERIVAGAGRANGAVMIDTMHVHRGGDTVEALRAAADVQGPPDAVEGVGPALLVLHLAEIGQHILVGPALAAGLAPVVVVARIAADIDR